MRIDPFLLCLTLAIAPSLAGQDKTPPAAALTSKYPIKVYGYIKLDASWDSSRLVPGNYGLYAASEATADDDAQINVTANQSRIGFSIQGPELHGIKTAGRLEFDFYGGGAENKARPMLRHAFVTATWEKQGLELLAGQTWDVISAYYLPTINYTAGMAVGDFGYRRPQIRLTKDFALAEKTGLKWQFALSRTIGDNLTINPNSPGDTGEDADMPTFQTRLGLTTTSLFAGRSAELALYGHYGQEEYDTGPDDQHETLDSWSVGGEICLPLHRMVTLKGSFYTGTNLDTYVGGIIQGVNTTTMKEIDSTGGFLYTTIKPCGDTWEFNLGWGVDDPDNGRIKTDGTGRSRNQIIFGNCWYQITPDLRAGTEVSYWQTDYKNSRAGTVLRVHLAMQYSF